MKSEINIQQNILGKISTEISSIVNEIWSQNSQIGIDLSFTPNNQILVQIKEDDKKFNIEQRSLGFQWFLAFVLHFNAKFGTNVKNSVLLFDEPGIHLHPHAQRDLLEQFRILAQENQIIYTTHLPFMVDPYLPESVVVFTKKDSITQKRYFKDFKIKNLVFLSEILGFPYGAFFNAGGNIVFVEGEWDKMFIMKYCLVHYKITGDKLLNLYDTSIIPLKGASNADRFSKVAELMNYNIVLVLDADSAGKNAAEKLKIKNAEDTVIYLQDEETLEDLIPTKIYNDIDYSSEFARGEIKFEDGKKMDQIKTIQKEKNIRNFKFDLLELLLSKLNRETINEFAKLGKLIKRIDSKLKTNQNG